MRLTRVRFREVRGDITTAIKTCYFGFNCTACCDFVEFFNSSDLVGSRSGLLEEYEVLNTEKMVNVKRKLDRSHTAIENGTKLS